MLVGAGGAVVYVLVLAIGLAAYGIMPSLRFLKFKRTGV